MLYRSIGIFLGLMASYILFAKFPRLIVEQTNNLPYKVSIIIPARNEEKNIALLLQDLIFQKSEVHEIICVDDCSTDETYKIASSFDVTTIAIKNKPLDWAGKAWACQVGADSS